MECVLFHTARICNSLFKCNYLKNEKLFFNFLFHFWNLHQILNILKEKMIVISNVFPKLQTMENLVRTLSKRRHFRARFDSQHRKALQTLPKSWWKDFFHVFSSFSQDLICKMSPLVLGEILAVFVSTLTEHGKYSVQDCENLTLQIQIELSEKQKIFSQIWKKVFAIIVSFKMFKIWCRFQKWNKKWRKSFSFFR